MRLFFEWFLNDEIHEHYVRLGGVSARKNVLMNQALIRPVSYTHLDVYKRQVLDKTTPAEMRVFCFGRKVRSIFASFFLYAPQIPTFSKHAKL